MSDGNIVMITSGKAGSFPIPELNNLGGGVKGGAETFGSPNFFFSAKEKEKRMPGQNQSSLTQGCKSRFSSSHPSISLATPLSSPAPQNSAPYPPVLFSALARAISLSDGLSEKGGNLP